MGDRYLLHFEAIVYNTKALVLSLLVGYRTWLTLFPNRRLAKLKK